MSRLKVNTLKRRTEEMTDMADNFNEIFKFGSEIEDIGNLIKRMAFHMKNLQDKVDTQAEELRRQQAVDAVEVVHGEWEQLCDPYFSKTIPTISRCTACGKKYNLPNISYNYCPNCGADMRGDKE